MATRLANRRRVQGRLADDRYVDELYEQLGQGPGPDTIEAPRSPFLAATQDYLSRIPDPLGFADSAEAVAGRLAYGEPPEAMDVAGLLSDVTPSGKALGAAVPLVGRVTKRMQTVKNPQRLAFPGVYQNPREMVQQAEARVAPESPYLRRLFGVGREDLAQIGQTRKGNLPGDLPGATTGGRGSAAAKNVMNPRNTQRLVDVLGETQQNAPKLYEGMTGWYVQDPAYKRMVELLGPEEATRQYERMNTFSGMASPGSDVLTEMNRGSAAWVLDNQGRFDEFVEGGGKSGRIAGMPDVKGHPYHKTAQATPMRAYADTGEVQMKSPKVPMYIQASGVPETGFQTATPVGDAHWSRGVGLADTRTSKGFGASVSTPEMQTLAPWWRDKVAGQVGLESVPAQATVWGAFGPQTGVETALGAPKLELMAEQIVKAANREGMSPETMRDLFLKGERSIGSADPALLAAIVGAGGVAALSQLDLTKYGSPLTDRDEPTSVSAPGRLAP